MNYLIKNIKIIDAMSPHHRKRRDILVVDGEIRRIEKDIRTSKKVEIIEGKDLMVSPGWLDVFANFCDPGIEYKEDLQSGIAAARNGGFTAVGVSPQTDPRIDNKSQVEYLLNNSTNELVDVLPVGAITKGDKEQGLTEMLDMQRAGAMAFAQGDKPVQNAGLMLKALEYSKAFNGVIFSFPEDKSIAQDGCVNESETSTQLGLRGKPGISEDLMVARDLYLAEYADARLHFVQLSTKEAVRLVKEAKKKGVAVTASVSPYHLIFDDKVLQDFNTNYKVNPPLRIAKDRKALIRALKEGVIDTITSFHQPQDEDAKKKEFEYAEYGISGIETVFSLLNTFLGDELSIEEIVDVLAARSRGIYKIEYPGIKEKTMANLTLFSTKYEWVLTEQSMKSKSKNHPLFGTELKGRVMGLFNNGLAHFNY